MNACVLVIITTFSYKELQKHKRKKPTGVSRRTRVIIKKLAKLGRGLMRLKFDSAMLGSLSTKFFTNVGIELRDWREINNILFLKTRSDRR